MNKIVNKMRSDDAAAMSGELLIIIALAIFAALALFKFVLLPIQQGAKETGNTIGTTIKNLLSGKDGSLNDVTKP